MTPDQRQIHYGTRSLGFITAELEYLIRYYMSDKPNDIGVYIDEVYETDKDQ